MKLWMSGEIHKDVADGYSIARNDVEGRINQAFLNHEFGRGLEKWAVIAIILPPGWGDRWTEVKKYDRRRRQTEFRLIINFETFNGASDTRQRDLIFDLLLRSIDLMEELPVPDVDFPLLRSVVLTVAKSQG